MHSEHHVCICVKFRGNYIFKGIKFSIYFLKFLVQLYGWVEFSLAIFTLIYSKKKKAKESTIFKLETHIFYCLIANFSKKFWKIINL